MGNSMVYVTWPKLISIGTTVIIAIISAAYILITSAENRTRESFGIHREMISKQDEKIDSILSRVDNIYEEVVRMRGKMKRDRSLPPNF